MLKSALEDISKYFEMKATNEKILLTKKYREQVPEGIFLLIEELQVYKQSVLYYLDRKKTSPKNIVAVDIETDARKFTDGKIKIIAVHSGNISFVTSDAEEAREILADNTILKIFHNAVFDVSWLEYSGYRVNNYSDTMILSQIINNSLSKKNGTNSLRGLSKKYLNVDLDKSLQAADNQQRELSRRHYNYCLHDAKITYELYKILDDAVDNLYLREVADREISVLPAIIEMTVKGVSFDFDSWRNEISVMEGEIAELRTRIKALLGTPNINLDSPIQLKKALRGVIKEELESTSSEYLSNFEGDYPIVDALLRFRKLEKQINAYGEKLRYMLDKKGLLHGNWRLIGTDTGRMSCSEPSLQGMPSVPKKYFKAQTGHSFIIADFSNIELRVLAEISQDNELITAFSNGEDLHRKTAKIIFNKADVSEVTDYERKAAKTVNFGIVYGMTKYGLKRRINSKSENKITIEEADIFIQKYLDTYRGVAEYQRKAMSEPVIKALGGRYWGGLTDPLDRYSRKRLNYPIQSSAAEGFKNAVAEFLNRRRKEWIFRLLVHDEIVIEVPDSDVEEAEDVLQKSMIIGMSKIVKSVPVVVDIKVNKYWDK